MLLRSILFAAILAAAAPALGQTPSQSAAARAMIDQFGVADLFDAVEDDSIAVRHRASGLTCHFYPEENPRNELLVFTSQLARGEDVGCVSENSVRFVTLYATRHSPPITAEHALTEAEAGIRARFSDARPTPAVLRVSTEDLPQAHTRHFLITIDGEQWITSALVARSGDWIIKVRYTARAADDAIMPAQLEANLYLQHVLLELND